MIENHTSCVKVSDTKICSYCIIKKGLTKTHKHQFFLKIVRKDFYISILIMLINKIQMRELKNL